MTCAGISSPQYAADSTALLTKPVAERQSRPRL
jgi:hypothetical protein